MANNKTGKGWIQLEGMCFGENEHVIGLSSSTRYPYEHEKSLEENRLLRGSGFRQTVNDHISQNNGFGFIKYKTAEARDLRLQLAKSRFEHFGYEVSVKQEKNRGSEEKR